MIEIVATRCHILNLKCTKFDFNWGSAPDPAGGANSAPPDPLAGFYWSYTSKGGRRKGRGRKREEKGREGKRKKEREREGEGRGKPQLSSHTPPQLGVSRNMPGSVI